MAAGLCFELRLPAAEARYIGIAREGRESRFSLPFVKPLCYGEVLCAALTAAIVSCDLAERATKSAQEQGNVIDIAYIGLILFAFAALIGYVRGCALLGREDNSDARGQDER
jgi:hypothetical protein